MLSWCLQSHLNGVCGSIHRIRNSLPTEFKWVSCLFSWCNIWDTKTSPLCITTVSFCVTWWQWKCVESYFHHKSFWNCDIPETSWVFWCLSGKIKGWKKSRGSTDNFWRGTCCKKNKQTSIAAIAGSHICHICQLSRIMRVSLLDTEPESLTLLYRWPKLPDKRSLDQNARKKLRFECHMIQNSKTIWLLMLVLQFLASFSYMMHVVHCKQKEESFFLVTPI